MQQSASQRTLFPEISELTPDDNIVFAPLLPDLQALGFDIEPFGKAAYSINGVPALMTDELTTATCAANSTKHWPTK